MSEKSVSLSLGSGVLAGVLSLFTGIAGLSACCMGPLALISLGAGGFLATTFEWLRPWQPFFIGVSLLALAMAAWSLFRASPADKACEGNFCSMRAQRLPRILFWLTSIFVLLVVSAPFVSPYLA